MNGCYHSYSQYQHSGVDWLGNIPTGWSVARVKQYANVTDGSHHSPTIENAGYPFISVTEVRRDDIDFEDCKKISTTDYQRLVREGCKPEPGNLLLTKDGTIGRAVVVGESDPPFVILSSLGLISQLRGLDGSFLRYFLVSGICVDQMNSMIHGSALRRLTIKKINELVLTFPEFPDQTQIAKFLDYETAKIDALIEKQQQLIALLQEKRQAVISHAVTKGLNPDAPMRDSGVEWLGKVPAHWEMTRLKYIKSKKRNAFVDGPFGSNLKSEHFLDNGTIFVIESGFATSGELQEEKLKRISEQHFATISRSEACEGDIIIAKIGARYGMSSILPMLSSKAVVSGNSLKLTVDAATMNVNYAHALLTVLKACGALDDDVNVTAQPALSLGGLNNILFLRPPLIEQAAIVSTLEARQAKLDDLIDAAQSLAETLTERRTALISAAVTGKIDVRGWKAPEAEAEAGGI